jgi:hypothetical protein
VPVRGLRWRSLTSAWTLPVTRSMPASKLTVPWHLLQWVLAFLLKDQGDLAAARPLFERALAIKEKVLGPEHPSTATILNNLALLVQDQGDLAAARSVTTSRGGCAEP